MRIGSTRSASPCTQHPTIRPSTHTVVPPLPARSNRYGTCAGSRWNSPAPAPAHRGRVERREERHPRLDRRRDFEVRGVVRKDTAGGAVVQRDAERLDGGQGAADGALRRSEPPDEVVLRRRPEGPQEPLDDRGIPGLRRGRLEFLTEPAGHRGPQRARRAPGAVVVPAHDVARRGEHGEEAAHHGYFGRPLRARRRRERPAEVGECVAQLAGRELLLR